MLHGMAKKKAQPTKQNTMVTLETQLRNTSEHEAALTFRSELQNAECSWGGGGKEEAGLLGRVIREEDTLSHHRVCGLPAANQGRGLSFLFSL